MAENRIKELRKAKGLSQQQLAEAARTSQQQIQRIEAGSQHARFDLATRISAALGEPVGKVFPSAELPLARLKKKLGGEARLSEAYRDEQASGELEEAGMDMEPAVWTVKYGVRGGANGHFRISGPDRHRLHDVLSGEDVDGFIVLDSTDRRYALNLKHLMFCHLLFDAPGIEPKTPEKTSDDDRDFTVEVYLADRGEPLRFDVDPDSESIDDETADGESTQLQGLFYFAEYGADGRLMFVDVDGETAFFRPDDVSLFSVAQRLLDPSALDDEDEEDEEEEITGHELVEPTPPEVP
jgi:transcriptional regulator with XRE-family HTH domain